MQSLLIFIAILLGVIFPQGHHLLFLIRYGLMIMLFFTFLQVRFEAGLMRRDHFLVIVLNFVIPLACFFLLRPWNETAALAALIIGLAPTAAVAPVIAHLLRARVDHVTLSVVVTSPVVAIVLPFLLPPLLSTAVPIAVMTVMQPVLIVVFGPLLLSWGVKKGAPALLPALGKFRKLPFALFLINVFIGSANASHFIRQDATAEWDALLAIAGAVTMLGLLLFKAGEFLGPAGYRLENSLCLGRKNTMFALWLAVTFINPLVAMGPMFYIFFQNVYNSWQIYRLEKRSLTGNRAGNGT